MSLLLQNLLDGLAAGSVYALLALGLSLVYRSSGVLNFAHGSVAMTSTFVAYQLAAWGWPLAAAMALCCVTAFALGAGMYRGVIHPARRGGPHTSVMLTMGLLMVLEGGAGALWGTDTKPFHHAFADPPSLPVGAGVFVTTHDAALVGAAAAMAMALSVALRRTRIGIAVRALGSNPRAAEVVGVRVTRLRMLTWGLASAIGAVAGLLLVPRVLLDPSMMFAPLLKAFAAAVLGGMASVGGAVLGGWLLGVIETLAGAYVSTDLQPSIAVAVLVGMLLVRPRGLLGPPPADTAR